MKDIIYAILFASGMVCLFLFTAYPFTLSSSEKPSDYFFTPIMLSEPHKANQIEYIYKKSMSIPDSVNIVNKSFHTNENFITKVDTPDTTNTVEKIQEIQEPAEKAVVIPAELGSSQININNETVVSYIPYFEQSSAPTHGAGLWLGDDSTTDGSWGYFIGHNPGDFAAVMDLEDGDSVTICDSESNSRTYYVVDTFIVDTSTYWNDIEGRVTQHGESVILQTCVGDHEHYKVVIAE